MHIARSVEVDATIPLVKIREQGALVRVGIAGKLPLRIDQGADWVLPMQWLQYNADPDVETPYNITGYTFTLVGRETPTATSALFTFSSPSSGIALNDAANGKFTLTIPNATSSAWTFDRGCYQLEVTTTGTVYTLRLLDGTFRVRREAVR